MRSLMLSRFRKVTLEPLAGARRRCGRAAAVVGSIGSTATIVVRENAFILGHLHRLVVFTPPSRRGARSKPHLRCDGLLVAALDVNPFSQTGSVLLRHASSSVALQI